MKSAQAEAQAASNTHFGQKDIRHSVLLKLDNNRLPFNSNYSSIFQALRVKEKKLNIFS
jgi:hypothetical protein